MTARGWTLVCLITLALSLAAFSVACGRYGPPVRVKRQPEPAEVGQSAEKSEEDSAKLIMMFC